MLWEFTVVTVVVFFVLSVLYLNLSYYRIVFLKYFFKYFYLFVIVFDVYVFFTRSLEKLWLYEMGGRVDTPASVLSFRRLVRDSERLWS